MTDFAIRVEGLSKQYRIGGPRQKYKTLRETLAEVASRPVSAARAMAARGRRPEAGQIFHALKSVSFEVGRGEVVGVIGRNGAGKSTLLKVLSRITEPSAGYVDICGRIGSLLEVGTGFHPELSGRENIYLNGAILGMKRHEIERKFDEIVEFSEVEKFVDTPVKHYSSGMYLRLAFGVAAHLEPEILLVDEVLAVGDAAFQKKCLGKMGEVAGQGRTVLFVSHTMAAVQALCTRAVILNAGELVFDGAVEAAVAKYINSVQTLVSTIPLAERADRKGGDVFRFEGIEFVDTGTGASLEAPICGQPVTLRVAFNNTGDKVIDDVSLSLAIFTSTGQYLCGVRSDTLDKTYNVPPGRGFVGCNFPRWPIKEGRYFYNLLAERRGTRLDAVSEAGYIDVQAGDYYGTGRVPAGARPGVLIDFDWQGTHTAA